MFGFSKSKQKKAFTIIELVVVTVIIAILSALSFLNYSSHLKEARNTTKIKDLTNIAEILDFYLLTWWELIEPDVASGSSLETGQKVDWIPDVFWKKWVFWENNFSKYGNISGKLKNPKTWERYTYYVSDDNKFYYLRVDLEWKPEKPTHLVTNYEKTRIVSTWDNLAFNPVPNPTPSQPGTPTPKNCIAKTVNWYQVSAMNHNWTTWVSKIVNNTPENGTTNYTATANCNNWKVMITWETSSVTCNAWYNLVWDQCVVPTPVCNNPIYLHTNWVTIKAKDCAVWWQEYSFNGNTYYVAVDKADIKDKISTWYQANKIVTTKVTDMAWIFYNNDTFNQAINSWDTSNVTDMSSMFEQAEIFNQPINFWDTSKVSSMNYMFYWAVNFNQPLNNWDVSKVFNMDWMFWFSGFSQNISSWNVIWTCADMFTSNSNPRHYKPLKCR